MTTTAWIIVIVVVLVAAAVIAWLMTQQRKNKQHAHAEHLRQEAHEHAAAIPQVQDNAKEAEAKAEVARLEAERAAREAHDAKVAATQQEAVHEDRLRTADEVDPRVDTRSDDHDSTTGTTHTESVRDADTTWSDDQGTTTGDTHRA